MSLELNNNTSTTKQNAHQEQSTQALQEEAVTLEKDTPTYSSRENDDRSDYHPSEEEDPIFALIMRDGLDQPIQKMEVEVTLPGGEKITGVTSEHGAIAVPMTETKPQGMAKVAVKDASGNLKTVCELDLERCKNAAIVRSPKVAATIQLRRHQQIITHTQSKPTVSPKNPVADKTSQIRTSEPWWLQPDAMNTAWKKLRSFMHLDQPPPPTPPATTILLQGLSTAGQPVTAMVGPECPNPDKLKLGDNNIYRAAILEAGKRLGLIPQAICGLLSCEAATENITLTMKNANGQAIVATKGKNKGKPIQKIIGKRWKANSYNASSHAAGLTQFLRGTWLGHCLLPGMWLHTQALAKGWVQHITDSQHKTTWQFVLANGTTTCSPQRHLADANVKACLDMRMDARWSILAAADYGRINFAAIKKQFNVKDLTDMDQAKLMYLYHHEGAGNGSKFIRNSFSDSASLHRIFNLQVGASTATKWINNADGNVSDAYRAWLADYIDNKFLNAVTEFFCIKTDKPTLLSDLCIKVGGAAIVFIPEPKK